MWSQLRTVGTGDSVYVYMYTRAAARERRRDRASEVESMYYVGRHVFLCEATYVPA